MEKVTIIAIALSVLIVISVVQAIQINNLKENFNGGTKNQASSSGESYEQMMARMHPDQVQSAKKTTSQPTMVGGC